MCWRGGHFFRLHSVRFDLFATQPIPVLSVRLAVTQVPISLHVLFVISHQDCPDNAFVVFRKAVLTVGDVINSFS